MLSPSSKESTGSNTTQKKLSMFSFDNKHPSTDNSINNNLSELNQSNINQIQQQDQQKQSSNKIQSDSSNNTNNNNNANQINSPLSLSDENMIDEEDPKNLNLNNSINSKLANKKQQPQLQQSATNSPRQAQQPAFLSKTKSRTLSNANFSSQASFNRQNSTVSLSSASPPFLGRQDRQDSLIFERLVQDPMIASRPSLSNVPSHYSSEMFIPAALDQSAHALNTNQDLDNVELVYSSRRASTANLQAALTGNSTINGQLSSPISPNPEGFNRSARGSVSSFKNSPFQPSYSYSNLTSALNGANNNNNITSPTFPPTGAPMRHSVSHSGNMSLNTNDNNNNNNDNSVDPKSPITPSLKPNKSTLSFFSYADMLNQEDSESPFEIRRPSISQSLSQSFVSPGRLSRTSSVPSVRANSVTNINPFANSNTNNNNTNNNNGSNSITNGGGLSINTMLQNTTGSNSPSLSIARSPALNRGYSNLRSNNSIPINLLNNNNNNTSNVSNTPKKFSIPCDSPSESSDNEDIESIGQKIPFPTSASAISGRSNSLAGLSRKTSHGPSCSNNNNGNPFSVGNRSRLSISSANSARPIFHQQQQQNLADALLNRTTSNSNSNNGDDEQSNFADDDESMHSFVTANVGETIRKYASEIQG
ncbi:hypothetical protein BVG19_g471 [[Candida] boidinii]|nr:hypothetical protein BVG19_g471 [[Candida] boidinii]OWB50264.1 hypothetical protein B5S27_g1812 [[Candida] boidinii]